MARNHYNYNESRMKISSSNKFHDFMLFILDNDCQRYSCSYLTLLILIGLAEPRKEI